jgi:hypothetical protein
MVHHRQRLTLGLESGDDLLGVHAEFDHLERHTSAHRLGLLSDIDHAAAALADFLQNLVAPDSLADGLVGRVRKLGLHGRRGGGRGFRKRTLGSLLGGQQGLKSFPQSRLAMAGAVQECCSFGTSEFGRRLKQDRFALLVRIHVLIIVHLPE